VGYVVIKISQPFWRTRILPIDVHPAKTRKRKYLQRCRTSGALVAPNLCDYVFYVNYVVQKKTSSSSAVKTNLNRFGEPAFSQLTSIRPKPGNENTYKDVVPLVLW